MFKAYVASLILLAAFGSLTTPHAHAQISQEVVTDGMGAIFHGDLASARDKAVDDALRNAVEQLVGTMLSSETLVENYTLVEDRILTKTQGYVRSYEVIEERQNTVDNVYEVRVRVQVQTGDLASDVDAIRQLIGAKGKPRLMVIFTEENVGKVMRDHPAETASLKYFRGQGFPLVDQTAVNNLRENESAMAAVRGDDQAAREIGLRQGAEVLIVGTGRSDRATGLGDMGGLVSCRATIEARVINCNSGEIIAVESATAPGLDISERTAGHKALTQAGKKLAEGLTSQIAERWQQDVYSAGVLRVLVHNVSDYGVLLQVKNALENGEIRGVRGVEIRNFSGNTAELEMEVEGSAQDLAGEVAAKNIGRLGLKVVGVVADKVELRLP